MGFRVQVGAFADFSFWTPSKFLKSRRELVRRHALPCQTGLAVFDTLRPKLGVLLRTSFNLRYHSADTIDPYCGNFENLL